MTAANDPPGPPSKFDPSGILPEPPRFDVSNVIVGAVVTCLLVAALGYGTILLGQAMIPPEEGANIGAAILASFGTLIAIALGAAFTAWRGKRRRSQPMWEGVASGMVGFVVVVVAAGVLFFVVWEVPLFEILNVLTLFAPGIAAAFAGATLGSLRRRPKNSAW